MSEVKKPAVIRPLDNRYKRAVSTCTVCEHKRASEFDLFCPDCSATLVPVQPRHRCQNHDYDGRPCQNYAPSGQALCESCRRLATGEARNGRH